MSWNSFSIADGSLIRTSAELVMTAAALGMSTGTALASDAGFLTRALTYPFPISRPALMMLAMFISSCHSVFW